MVILAVVIKGVFRSKLQIKGRVLCHRVASHTRLLLDRFNRRLPAWQGKGMKDTKTTGSKLDQIIAENRRHQDARAKTYREQALKMYPWICGRCSREFTRQNLTELTVHHRNHNHDDNPVDGSNWELLCLYCHDNEHQRQLEAQQGGSSEESGKSDAATFNPFAGLKDMLDTKE